MLRLLAKLLLSAHPDSLSSTRFSFLLCVFMSNLSVFGIWGYMSFSMGVMAEIPESVIMLYCLANGITFTGKMVQKHMETIDTGKEAKTK